MKQKSFNKSVYTLMVTFFETCHLENCPLEIGLDIFFDWVKETKLNLNSTKQVNRMINILQRISKWGFDGEFIMFYYTTPWDILGEYDI